MIADRLAGCGPQLQDGRRAALRLVAEEVAGRRSPAAASVAKVTLTELAQRLAQFATELAGPAGTVGARRSGSRAVPEAPDASGTNSSSASTARSAWAPMRSTAPASAPRWGCATRCRKARWSSCRRAGRRAPSPPACWLGRTGDRAGDGPGYDAVAVAGAAGRGLAPRLFTGRPAAPCSPISGRACCPLPVHAGLVQPLAALAVLGEPAAAHREALLAGVRYAFAAHDAAGRPVPQRLPATARAGGDGWVPRGHRPSRHLRGTAFSCSWCRPGWTSRARRCCWSSPADAAGVRRSTYRTLSGDRLSDFVLDGVTVPPGNVLAGPGDPAAAAVAAAAATGLLAHAAELSGMAAELLRRTVERVRTRQALRPPARRAASGAAPGRRHVSGRRRRVGTP